MVRGISAGSVTRKLCLVIGIVMPRMSASWKASVPIAALADLAGDRHHRHRVHVGVGDRGDQVGRARARWWPCRRRPGRWRRRTPGRRGRRPARGGPGCAGSGGVHQRVVRREDRAARDAEDVLGARRLQRPDQALRAGDLLAHRPASLSGCRRRACARCSPGLAQQKTPRPGGQRGGTRALESVAAQPTRRVRTRISWRMTHTLARRPGSVTPVCPDVSPFGLCVRHVDVATSPAGLRETDPGCRYPDLGWPASRGEVVRVISQGPSGRPSCPPKGDIG